MPRTAASGPATRMNGGWNLTCRPFPASVAVARPILMSVWPKHPKVALATRGLPGYDHHIRRPFDAQGNLPFLRVPATDLSIMHVGRPHTYRWLISASLLVCLGVLAPQTAQAVCGHYAARDTDAALAEAIGVVQPNFDWVLTRTSQQPPPSQEPPASPCDGLRCSRDSSSAFPPSAVPRAVRHTDLWGSSALDATASQRPSAFAPSENDCSFPARRADRLDRPPR